MHVRNPDDATTTSSVAIELLRERLTESCWASETRLNSSWLAFSPKVTCCSTTFQGLGRKPRWQKAVAQGFGAKFAPRAVHTRSVADRHNRFQLVQSEDSREFEFHAGPVFSDILLADEINRNTPRTQSALFEAWAERQVTIDGQSRPTLFDLLRDRNAKPYR